MSSVGREDAYPVAVRAVRPFADADEFLAHEANTVARTGVLLVGAPSRPQGVILRFELTLTSGDVLLRGEGRVVGYRENVIAGEPGLLLKFTKLDSASKDLVDRATEYMLDNLQGPAPEPVIAAGQGDIDAQALPSMPPDRLALHTPHVTTAEVDAGEEADFDAAEVTMDDTPRPALANESGFPPLVPGDRDALLARLRDRHASLSEEDIAALLALATK